MIFLEKMFIFHVGIRRTIDGHFAWIDKSPALDLQPINPGLFRKDINCGAWVYQDLKGIPCKIPHGFICQRRKFLT